MFIVGFPLSDESDFPNTIFTVAGNSENNTIPYLPKSLGKHELSKATSTTHDGVVGFTSWPRNYLKHIWVFERRYRKYDAMGRILN